MSNVQIAVSVIFSTLVLYYYNYTYWRRNRVKQRFPQVPIFGDNYRHFFGKTPYHKVLEALYWKFPTSRYTGFYQYMQPGLMIRDLKLIKKVCIDDFHIFMDRKSFLPRSADPLWNKNLFALQGHKWKEMRNTLSFSFTANNMEVIWHLVNNTADRFCEHLLSNTVDDEIEVKFKDIFTRFATDVIGTAAFGHEVDSMGEPNNEFYRNGSQAMLPNNFWRNFKLQLCLILPILGKIFKAHIFDEEVSEYFRNLIWGIIEHREANDIQRPDMLQLLVRRIPETHFDNDDITSQALVFFLGGFETVSSALCFMAYELALNQDVQERLYREIYEFGENLQRDMTYSDIKSLKYLDMVFNETLRKWPPLLNMDRMCVEPYTIKPEDSGEETVDLEESTLIWIPIWAIHHDPQYWPDPETFDPERFEENKSRKGFIPFGLGNRGCLGFRFATMEIKLLFIHLLKSFRIERSAKSQVPFVPVVHSFSLTSQDGFCFKLVKRRRPSKVPTFRYMDRSVMPLLATKRTSSNDSKTGLRKQHYSESYPSYLIDRPYDCKTKSDNYLENGLRVFEKKPEKPSTPEKKSEESENQLSTKDTSDTSEENQTSEDSEPGGDTLGVTKQTQTSHDSDCPRSMWEDDSQCPIRDTLDTTKEAPMSKPPGLDVAEDSDSWSEDTD